MKTTHELYKYALALLLAVMGGVSAWGQAVTGDWYRSRYENGGNSFNTSRETIQPKPAKWHSERTGGNYVDTFDDDILYFSYDSQEKIQATHTIVDTIYVEKGTSVVLALPDRNQGIDAEGNSNIGSYQRWYNFRTGETFKLNEAYSGWREVQDLLTPVEGTYYRFTNGYLNRPLVVYNASLPARMRFYYPTDREFEHSNYAPEGQDNNNFYLVACDLSGYTDFDNENNTPNSNDDGIVRNFFKNNGFYEPTLTHRVIYYLVGVEGNRSLPSEPEVYEIDFPAYTYPNKSNELVALPMDARSYYAGTGASQLTVSISDNTAGILLLSNNAEEFSSNASTVNSITLDDDDRSIFFRMPNRNANDGSRYVNGLDGDTAPTATINVNVGTTTVLQFKLTFRNESRLLTQTMVNRLDSRDNSINGTTWRSLRYRTPDSLSHVHNLLTELNFDYEASIAQGVGDRFYPYPLAWESNSYGFYDGTNNSGFIGGGAQNYYYPEYGSYSLLRSTNGYIEHKDGNQWGWGINGGNIDGAIPPFLENSDGNNSTYHLFVDASDRPGLIARLPFEEDLCVGSVLYVSAWVKTARWNNTSANAAVLFTIMGVDAEGNYTPIYRHQTGQIPATYGGMNDFHLTAPGLSDNEWMQTYFSFVNPSNQTFDHYVLQIDNNSPSTQGGDIYIDDIRVYISRPMAEVQQLEMACTDDRTRMNLKIDWNRFCQRVENVPEGTGGGNLGICFIDTLIFHNTFKGDNYKEALDSAVVDLGEFAYNTRHYRLLHYYGTFDSHKDYDEADADNRIAANNKYYLLKQTTEDGTKYLTVDFYGDLIPNRAYWVLMVPNISNEDVGEENEITYKPFTGFYTDPCALLVDFKVQGDEIIKINGEIVTPETEFCQGNIYNFTVDLRVPIEDEYVTVTDGIYYDWFFGTTDDPLTEYLSVNSTYGVSLRDALRVFRNLYPDADNLNDVTFGGTDDTGAEFTEAMYNLLKHYAEMDAPSGGQNRPLVLHEPSLSITLLEKLQLVICPIPTLVPPEGLGITDKEWEAANICWGYTYLSLETTEKAPTLHAGFNTMRYPDEHNPNLRIGRAQIEELSTGNKSLTVDLRGAQSYDEDKKEGVTLRRVRQSNGTTIDLQYAKIYLTDSDDPDVKDYLNDEDYTALSLPIGDLVSLEAHEYSQGTTQQTNKMEIQFDLTTKTSIGNRYFTFNPKEGYYYTFSVYYEEMVTESDEIGTACIGTFPVTMKVVPEYLVWEDVQKDDPSQPDEVTIGNWNYDGNWKRATNEELKMKGTSTYPREGNASGFVPMLFSKVIMPRDSKVQLYAAGLQIDGTSNKWITYRPENVAVPTDSIQYDLMAYTYEQATGDYQVGDIKTQPYRVSIVNQIHFEPGAEMLHAEYLLYDTAWVDYELDGKRWYTLASPLHGVVAGDFYTDSNTGTEGSEYFKDITYNTTDNNRFSPSVYQRGWKLSEATLQTLSNDTKEVAVAGNWSSVYNKVDESYDTGTGFSLKVQDLESDDKKALFRLPKADNQYYYFNYNNGSPTQGTDYATVTRVQPGRLKSDVLFNRNTNFNQSSVGDSITVTLTSDNNTGYYLIENPFMAHLNMNAFFKINTQFEPTCWLVTGGNQSVVVGGTSESDWISTDGDATVAPLQSFFVKLSGGSEEEDVTDATEIKVVFGRNMQVLGDANDGLRSSSDVLYLSATTSDGRTSRAAVAYDGEASAEYVSGEDAELFLDSNLGDVPMVYTVAGTMATSINRTSQLADIPVGLYGNAGETATLAFEGLDSFSGATLYDAQEGTETLLYDGRTVTVPARTSGRYFLRLGAATDNKTISARKAILIYTVGRNRVVVSSDGEPLQTIRVYNMAGSLVRQERVSGMQYEFTLPAGIYIVSAEDRNGMLENVKVRTR